MKDRLPDQTIGFDVWRLLTESTKEYYRTWYSLIYDSTLKAFKLYSRDRAYFPTTIGEPITSSSTVPQQANRERNSDTSGQIYTDYKSTRDNSKSNPPQIFDPL